MIITVQGYKGKKNNATQLTASLAAMMAMKFNTKNLVIELIGQNIETVESMLIGTGLHEQIGKVAYVDQGIDSLLREANVGKLVKGDFDQYCLPIIKNENALDICTVTSDSDNERFLKSLNDKVDVIKRIIESAENVYDNIFILLPSENSMHDFRNKIKAIEGPDEKQITKVNKRTGKKETETIHLPLVDVSIVCLHQAHMKEDHVEGRKVIYTVTKFDENSWFNLQNMSQNFGFSKNPLDNTEKFKFCKVTNCTQCNDAGYRGRLANFVHENRELNIEDINYIWTYDILNLIALIAGDKVSSFVTDSTWEFEKLYQKEEMLNELSDKIQESTGDMLLNEADSDEELVDHEINTPVDLEKEEVNDASVTDEDVDNLLASIVNGQNEELSRLEAETEEEKPKKKGLFGRKKETKKADVKKEEAPQEETETSVPSVLEDILYSTNTEPVVNKEVTPAPATAPVLNPVAPATPQAPQASANNASNNSGNLDVNALAQTMAVAMAQAMVPVIQMANSQNNNNPDKEQ